MSIFKQLCRTLVLSAVVAALSVGLMGCPETPDEPDVPPSTVSQLSCGTRECRSVTIGNQTWMAENMNMKTEDSRCFKNDEYNCTKFGRLYTWDMAVKICPKGWHLPSEGEWGDLIQFVGDPVYAAGTNNAGTKLKSTTGGWSNKATDDFGFSALPNGKWSTVSKDFVLERKAFWWTSTSSEDANRAYYVFADDVYTWVHSDHSSKSDWHAVRCVLNN